MIRNVFLSIATTFISTAAWAQDVIKVGIIGLDTSHSPAFTELMNADSDDMLATDFEVVAAYPYGSTTIENSYKKIPQNTEAVKKHGVKITESIADMLDMVDVVLLETNDGRIHLEQAEEVFKAGKICYIDKPIGATLGQAMAIFELAEKYGIPIFSSSALRYSPRNADIRAGKYGEVQGADCYSPHFVEPTHPDFGYYGIHGVETLFTVMGTGCVEVVRMNSPEQSDVVLGRWNDGRLGSFRGVMNGTYIYGGTVFTQDGAIPTGGYEGYKVLLDEIAQFFKTGKAPVSKEETLEIFAFMKAANMSRDRGGKPVTRKEAYKEGEKEARKLLKNMK